MEIYDQENGYFQSVGVDKFNNVNALMKHDGPQADVKCCTVPTGYNDIIILFQAVELVILLH